MQTNLIIPPEMSLIESLSLQGELWRISFEASIAAGASYIIGVTSANNVMLHELSLRTGADRMRMYLHENVAYSAGTTRVPLPKNRQNPKASVSVWKLGVTATPPAPLGGGIMFGTKAGGAYEKDENFILKKDTPYLLQFINDANSQADIVFAAVDFGELVLPI